MAFDDETAARAEAGDPEEAAAPDGEERATPDEPSTHADGRATDTRARIQATALQLFATKGFGATSLRDIAEALGVTKAALYYHFPAKADLARSVFQPFVDDIDAFLDEVRDAGLPPRELLEAYFDVLVRHRAVFLSLLRDASGLAYVDLEAAIVRWLEQFQELLIGPNATRTERTRAIVAVGGLSRCMLVADEPVAEIRAAGVAAALAALSSGADL